MKQARHEKSKANVDDNREAEVNDSLWRFLTLQLDVASVVSYDFYYLRLSVQNVTSGVRNF